MIYPNDHRPANVHILGPDWVVVINLIGPVVREVINCSEREARRALRLVTTHKNELMGAWKRIHG